MATQATIMEGQKEITRQTLPAMQAQATAAVIAANAAAQSAQEAHLSNEQSKHVFEEEEAAKLAMLATPSGFGTDDAKISIQFTNVGHRGASAISVREMDFLVPADMTNYRPFPKWPDSGVDRVLTDPGLPAHMSPSEVAELTEDAEEQRRLAEIMNARSDALATLFDPVFGYENQSPTLPPEKVFLDFDIQMREYAIQSRKHSETYWRQKGKRPQLPELQPVGKTVNLIEIGQNQTGTTEIPVQVKKPAFDTINARQEAFYFAVRFSYWDGFKTVTGFNQCLRYDVKKATLVSCQKTIPDPEQNRTQE
jgi:hypothetical protein